MSAEREVALEILAARFGTAPDDLRQRIERLDTYQDLKSAVVIIATATALEDVRAQLP